VEDQDFDKEWWPLVTKVWTKYNSKCQNNGNSWVVSLQFLAEH
ncbi:820_t:CDS:1, partial [Gigaspora rosea]